MHKTVVATAPPAPINGPEHRRTTDTNSRNLSTPTTNDLISISVNVATRKFVAGKANVLLHVTALGPTQRRASMIAMSDKDFLPRMYSAVLRTAHAEPTIAEILRRIRDLKS